MQNQTTTPFEQVLTVADLAQLINKNPSTIFADRSRAPHRLPPCCTPPGTKQPLWLLEDVLDWLRQHRAAPAPTPAPAEQQKRGRGRPRKIEQGGAA